MFVSRFRSPTPTTEDPQLLAVLRVSAPPRFKCFPPCSPCLRGESSRRAGVISTRRSAYVGSQKAGIGAGRGSTATFGQAFSSSVGARPLLSEPRHVVPLTDGVLRRRLHRPVRGDLAKCPGGRLRAGRIPGADRGVHLTPAPIWLNESPIFAVTSFATRVWKAICRC